MSKVKIVKLNEEVSMSGKVLQDYKKLCRKEGAVEELRKLHIYTQTTSNGGRKHLMKKIKERLIELEGKGE